MKISIAGAGAGKTTTMADTIVNLQSEVDGHLNIFCITFTNNAVACIERKLKEHYGELPDNIIVSTICLMGNNMSGYRHQSFRKK